MASEPKKPRLDAGDEVDGVSNTRRPPFTNSHKITRESNKFHLLIGITGSVAVIKLKELIQSLYEKCSEDRMTIKIVATENAVRLLETQDIEIEETIYEDRDEWSMWRERGDAVLHIELRKWADGLLLAPLDANSLAKISHGICDNLLTSLVRAWDPEKPCYFAPAMNTAMWENPLTVQQTNVLRTLLQFKEMPPISKELMCGDRGMGAMASVNTIVSIVGALIRDRLAIRVSSYDQ